MTDQLVVLLTGTVRRHIGGRGVPRVTTTLFAPHDDEFDDELERVSVCGRKLVSIAERVVFAKDVSASFVEVSIQKIRWLNKFILLCVIQLASMIFNARNNWPSQKRSVTFLASQPSCLSKHHFHISSSVVASSRIVLSGEFQSVFTRGPLF